MKSLGERSFERVFSLCCFSWKKQRKRMSLNRWWKEGEWVESLGYFEKIEVSRIMLGAWNFRRIF
jgi:hypothetical protein